MDYESVQIAPERHEEIQLQSGTASSVVAEGLDAGLCFRPMPANTARYLWIPASDVGWRLDDMFVMTWIERNGPPVSAPQRSGFGRAVVISMVKRTVNGEVQLNYASSGVMWNLTCPAANVLDRNALNKKLAAFHAA